MHHNLKKIFIMNIKHITSVLFIIVNTTIYAQQFTNVSSVSLEAAYYGDVTIGKFTNTSNQDILVTGTTANDEAFTGLYLQSNNFQLNSNPEFTPLQNSSIASGDLNNDGLIDFAISGRDNNYTETFEVYYNSISSGFTKVITSGITPTSFGSLEIADLNNDNLKDILISGLDTNSNYITQLYFQGINGTFTLSNQNFMGTYFGANKIFDANGDGYMDILVTGFSTSYVPETKLYLNNGGNSFTEFTSGISNVYFSSIDVFDVDSDADLDVVISGMDGTYTPILKLYLNSGTGSYIDSNQIFIGTYTGGTRFLDFNNDGFKDIISTGNEGTNYYTYLYEGSSTGTFTNVTTSLLQNVDGISMGKIAILDYDNDTDDDFFIMGINNDGDEIAKIYSNNQVLKTEDFSKNSLSFFPNPCKNSVQIVTEKIPDLIEVFDLFGRKLSSHVATETIDTSALPIGTYIVKTSIENKINYNKIIKQ